MSTPQIKDDIWYRLVPKDWQNAGGFRTDVRPSVLNDLFIKRALFIVSPGQEGEYAILIPMDDIRRALSSIAPGRNGSIPFSVDLAGSINGLVVEIKKVRRN